jgi:hypothetical protein
MASWLSRNSAPEEALVTNRESIAPGGSGISKTFLALHQHLMNRFADVVVLTFGQLEDVIGSPLPRTARLDLRWWSGDDANNSEHTNSWRLANRTAVPNLTAQTVKFERA